MERVVVPNDQIVQFRLIEHLAVGLQHLQASVPQTRPRNGLVADHVAPYGTFLVSLQIEHYYRNNNGRYSLVCVVHARARGCAQFASTHAPRHFSGGHHDAVASRVSDGSRHSRARTDDAGGTSGLTIAFVCAHA